MNSVFDFKRFVNLLKREITLRFVPLGIAGLIMVLSFLLLWYTTVISVNEDVVAFFFVVFIMTGAVISVIMPSRISNCFAKKIVCTDFLTVPSSMFEKYLARITTNVFYPIGLFSILVCLINVISVDFMQNAAGDFVVIMVTITAIVGSLNIFWGAFLRKGGGFVTTIIVTSLIIWFINAQKHLDFMFLDPIRVYVQNDNGNTHLAIVLFAFVFATFVICTIPAYFIFRRKQMIVKTLNR